LKAICELPEAEQELSGKHKPTVLKAIMHAVDIGNPTRKFEIAIKWAKDIVKEFFHQGDCELKEGLEISMLCDRHTVNFASS